MTAAPFALGAEVTYGVRCTASVAVGPLRVTVSAARRWFRSPAVQFYWLGRIRGSWSSACGWIGDVR